MDCYGNIAMTSFSANESPRRRPRDSSSKTQYLESTWCSPGVSQLSLLRGKCVDVLLLLPSQTCFLCSTNKMASNRATKSGFAAEAQRKGLHNVPIRSNARAQGDPVSYLSRNHCLPNWDDLSNERSVV
ncbi:hypothetical protein C0J52_09515 [Blattella germanica]|nr:hypothetical protein C0J52_09515 [Blattella germanica]